MMARRIMVWSMSLFDCVCLCLPNLFLGSYVSGMESESGTASTILGKARKGKCWVPQKLHLRSLLARGAVDMVP